MMKSLALSSLALFSSAYMVCVFADDEQFRPDTNCSTIMDIVCDSDNGLATDALCEAIKLAGLQDDLDTDTWTLFAPTNDAFDSLSEEIIDSLLGGPTMDDTRGLMDLIAFHAVPGVELNSTALKCEERTFMTNEEYSVTICEGDRLFQVGAGNPTIAYPEIIGANIEACNGIVHTLSGVMLYKDFEFDDWNATTSSATNVTSLLPTPSPFSIPTPPTPSPIEIPAFTESPSGTPSTSSAPTTSLKPSTSAVPSVSTEPSDSISPTTSERPTTSLHPSAALSTEPSLSVDPSSVPSLTHSVEPSLSFEPTAGPSSSPSVAPSDEPSFGPSQVPSTPPSISKLPTTKPSLGPSFGPEPCSVAEIACASDEFTHLCTAIKATGLDEFFNDYDGNYTVFAPNDSAFENLGEVALAYLMDPANVNLLTEILSFHTVDDQVIYSQDLICMETTEMSNGRDSRTVCRRQTLFQKGIGNSAFEKPEIIETDIDSCSGVIHVVDEVMLYKTRAELGLPPKDAISVPKSPVPKYPVALQTPAPTRAHVDNTCKSIDELVCDNADFSILCEKLESTGLAGALSTGTWTLFAPTNEAFLKLPPNYVQMLSTNPGVLTRLLLFHAVAEKAMYKNDLPCFAGENLITMANDKDSRTLCKDTSPGMAVPMYQKGKFNPIHDMPAFVNFDMEACNGVVHKLDGVMLFRQVKMN